MLLDSTFLIHLEKESLRLHPWRLSVVGLHLLTFSALLFLRNAVYGQPANDAFAQRQVLSVLPSILTADTRGATGETGEPSFGYSTPLHSVWWTWTAPANGFVRIVDDGPHESLNAAATKASVGNDAPAWTLSGRALSSSAVLIKVQGEVGKSFSIETRPIS